VKIDLVVKSVRPLIAFPQDWVLRGLGFQILRYLIQGCNDAKVVRVLQRNRIHLFVVRSLEREHK
jgi:hypothetical protein